MRNLKAFVFTTLNGFYKGQKDDISWHIHGEEGSSFSESQLASNNILLFGRKTFEMMFSFWPTPIAYELYPIVAEKMNRAEKLVVSNTLNKIGWENSKIIGGNVVNQIKKLKQVPGKNITILGSGMLVKSLAEAKLIDEYDILIDPVILKKGTPLFGEMKDNIELVLTGQKIFKQTGSVLLQYKRA